MNKKLMAIWLQECLDTIKAGDEGAVYTYAEFRFATIRGSGVIEHHEHRLAKES